MTRPSKKSTPKRSAAKPSAGTGALPAPRNAVELPVYGFLRWRYWAPIQLVLGLPYRDLDDRFAPHRLAAVSTSTRAELDPLGETGLAAVADAHAAGPADFAVCVQRPLRRGPRRSTDSMQLIVDLGLDRPAVALAMILLWRDEAIIKGHLGTTELANQTSRWWRSLGHRAENIRQHRVRLRKAGVSGAAPWIPTGIEAMRRAAVVCARGTASRCGGARADALVADALARYGDRDPLLASVALPEADRYHYHPEVRNLVHHFVTLGGDVADYEEERTHVVLRGERPRGCDDAGELDL